jgi:Zn-dependent peptidase ImmA (M78 family)
MSFKDNLQSLLKESVSFDKTPIQLNNITYATSLQLNDDKKAIIKSFVDYIVKKLGLQKIPKINFVAERVGKMTTGAYSPADDTIHVLYGQRLLADVLRTLAHELVHAQQRKDKKFDLKSTVQDAGGPIEDEANAKAGEYLKTFVRDLKMDVIYSL